MLPVINILIKTIWLFFLLLPITTWAEPTNNIKTVETTKLSIKDVTKTINLVGIIKANKESTIFAQIEGNIDIIEELQDQLVKKNQVIAQLVNNDLQLQLKLIQSSEEIAKQNYQRIQKLTQTHTASLASLEEAEQRWIQTKIALNNIQQQLDKTIIKAPFDGLLGPFTITEGAMVKTGEKLVTIYDLSSYIIELNVPRHILAALVINQQITANGNTAHIVEIQKTLDPITHTGIIRAKLHTCDNCLVGQTIEVNISLYHKDKALTVANEAIFLQNDAQYVYVIKNHKTILRKIKIGVIGDHDTEVKNGLTVGDVVVLHNPFRLSPNMEVDIIPKNA